MSSSSSISMTKPRTLYRQQPRVRNPLRVFSFLPWVFLLTSAGIFCLWTCLSVQSQNQEMAKIKAEISELKKQNEQLRGEVAQLEGPARLEKIAKETLGLNYPEPSQIFSLGSLEEAKEVTMVQP